MTTDLPHKQVSQYINNEIAQRIHIVTGGQTGTDRAAMDFALENKIPLRGWCPKNRIAEDGVIAAFYPLQETISEDPALRTELNVIDSDGTLLLSIGKPTDGTPLTVDCAKYYKKPFLAFDLSNDPKELDREMLWRWLTTANIKILNIAGPRESHMPGLVYQRSLTWLQYLFDATLK